jgi:hypothetical protein
MQLFFFPFNMWTYNPLTSVTTTIPFFLHIHQNNSVCLTVAFLWYICGAIKLSLKVLAFWILWWLFVSFSEKVSQPAWKR